MRRPGRTLRSGRLSGVSELGERNAPAKDRKTMRIIKAVAAIAALIFMAACSSEQAAVAPATTTVTPGSVADFRQNVGDRVFFDTDMSNIREDGRADPQPSGRVAEEVHQLRRSPSKAIATSAARASTTWRSASAAPMPRASTWSPRAFPAARIKTISYGKERPGIGRLRRGRLGAQPPRRHRRCSRASQPGLCCDFATPVALRPAFSLGGRAAMPENGRV